MDDFTSEERRPVLGALWWYREQLGRDFGAAAGEDTDDAFHEMATMDRLDSAVRKLGGDSAKDLYGAPEYWSVLPA